MAFPINPFQSYISFWTHFQQVCKDYRLLYSPNSIPFKHSKVGNDYVIALIQPIHLQGWVEHSGSTKKKIDILVDGNESVNSDLIIVKSSVSVNYFDTSEKKHQILKPIQSIHYDFGTSDVGHPHFHAQLSEGLIKDSGRSETFRRFTLDPPQLDDRLKGMRIPTAHMSLVSVLVGLIADHTRRVHVPNGANQGDEHAQALEKIIEAIRRIPTPPMACCEKPSMKADTNRSYRSILWYPEFA